MRVLIFSDTHGNIDACINTVSLLGQVDMVVHLGDYIRDAIRLAQKFPNIKIECVSGNNDFGVFGEHERIIEAGGRRLFITHGHRERVKSSLDALADKVKSQDADIGLFGHTHRPLYGQVNGVWLLNPGSASSLMAAEPSCGILEIDTEMKGMILKPIWA